MCGGSVGGLMLGSLRGLNPRDRLYMVFRVFVRHWQSTDPSWTSRGCEVKNYFVERRPSRRTSVSASIRDQSLAGERSLVRPPRFAGGGRRVSGLALLPVRQRDTEH